MNTSTKSKNSQHVEILQDHFVVEIERLYEDIKTKSGIILLNSAYIDDTDMDRNEHKRIYGTITALPLMFSDTPFKPIDTGMPPYYRFIGHDSIVDKINRGYRDHSEKSYYPSTFDDYPVLTVADMAKDVNVRIGDKVYFDPKTTEPEQLLPKENGKMRYMLHVADVFCTIGVLPTDDIIKMQGEWVLVKPDMETWEEITTPAGIIKKPQPDKKWLQGVVAHTRHEHLRVGSKIVYLPNADCEVTVEGEKYFVMPAQDIIGELTN